MDELLISNGRLVVWGEEIRENGALLLQDGRIAALGDSATLARQHPEAGTLDARGQLVMPGNICAHTHFYGAFARGLAIPGPPMKDFPDILERLWWRLDRALLDVDVKYSALVCLVDAIKHGTTTLIDHHASPNAIDSSLDQIAEAVETAGVRAVLCYEVTDRNGPAGAQKGIGENVRFLHSLKERRSPLLAGTFGLHASLSLSDETLADCVAAVQELNTGFHIHVAEHEADEYNSLQRYGRRVVDRLAAAGILGPKSIVAHAVHVDPAEMALLRETKSWVTHQPRSNMNNAVGAADVEGMLRLGIPVCLGNDGFSNNMWAEWKSAYLLHKVAHRDPRRAGGLDVVQMAVHNNAALAGVFWPDLPIGQLAVGAAADLIFVDYYPTTPLTAGNLPWHVLFGFESSLVTTTIVAGEVLMRDRQLLTLDEAEITARSRELAAAVWQRFVQLSEN
ncbi:MAG: putative aminohydrolase SsnA [Chloroflexi bacterium]|nr:putative aminohydrolase SsnA [Chloroflexota bacterium]MCI0577137.1 putative aminohydrolase SsnA [Chloroflexota bacterium]MCI0644677.1 putative aminohydrolase SsnA [Chloroflexota bacterium]MCI0730375.1 putative aminohydrolase SsnA [Chloroflexota bacterium]